jgi:hypothetical protein
MFSILIFSYDFGLRTSDFGLPAPDFCLPSTFVSISLNNM